MPAEPSNGLVAHVRVVQRAGVEAVRGAGLAKAPGGPIANPLPAEGCSTIDTSFDVLFGASGLFEAGDLNGDRRADLVDARYLQAGDGSLTLGLQGRRGTDGALLWSRTFRSNPGRFVFAVPARVGASARPGIAVIEVGEPAPGRAETTASLTITAVAGSTGRTAWTWGAAGTVRTGSAVSAEQVPVLVAQLSTRGADRFLVSVSDGSEGTGAVPLVRGRTQPLLVDGATGRARSAGPPVERLDALPEVAGTPDLSGDGQDDLAVLSAGRSSEVLARSAADGSDLWSNAALSMSGRPALRGAGRLTSTNIDDVAVAFRTPEQPASPTDLDGREGADRVALLRGRDGRQAWQTAGYLTEPLGKAGRPGRAALAVVDFPFGCEQEDPPVTVTARDGSGRPVWTTRLPGRRVSSILAYSVGDLTGDGVQELFTRVAGSGGGVRFLDGSTGKRIDRQGDPLYAGLSRKGDDLAAVAAGNGLRVTVRNGRSGGIVLTRQLATGTRFTDGFVTAGRLGDGPCAHLIVSGLGDASFSAVLDNAGQLRWALTDAGGSATGPRRLTAGRTPVARCQ